MSDTDMVKFQMPDGTEVSNDPRFDIAKAQQKLLDSTPNIGHAGTPVDEEKAQVSVEHLASLQSGQAGVGPNSTLDDPTRDLHGPLGSPAQQRQVEDAKKAQEEGGSPQSTTVDDADPVDSNEAVAKARKDREAALEKLVKTRQKLTEKDQEPGNPDEPYSEWSGAQLMHEVATRNADEGRSQEDHLTVERGMKTSDVAEMLENDDNRQAGSQS